MFALFTHAELEAAFWADMRAGNRQARRGLTFSFKGCEVSRSSMLLRSISDNSPAAWRSSFHVKPPAGEAYIVRDERAALNWKNDPDRD